MSNLSAKLAAHHFYNTSAVNPLTWHALKAQGVDFDAVTDLIGPICLHSVTFTERGGFVYDELGEAAFVHVVSGEDGKTEMDIIAWSARDPFVFGALLHRVSILGSDYVLNPASFYGGRPCPLWRTPLRWLQARCEGAVVIQAVPASTIVARAPGKLVAENENHARALVASGAVARDKVLYPVIAKRVAA